jgi:hypothetical protein
MVHAYLMYGFPTQTKNETIEALEVVRQLFENELLDSAFWHRFSLTAHSPIFQNPSEYGVKVEDRTPQGFAFNDVSYQETSNTTDHGAFAEGLRAAVYNFMHRQCLKRDVSEWFEFKVPRSKADRNLVKSYKQQVLEKHKETPDSARLLWLGTGEVCFYEACAAFETTDAQVSLSEELGEWLNHLLSQLGPSDHVTYGDLRNFYCEHFDADTFDDFILSDVWSLLCISGLLILREIPKVRCK